MALSSHVPVSWCLLILAVVTENIQESISLCQFPSYLHDPFPNGSPRYWRTESQYDSTTDELESEYEILVTRTEITRKMRIKAQCSMYGTDQSCFQLQLTSHGVCFQEEEGMFKVVRMESGIPHYKCQKFMQRSANIVQIYSGVTVLDPKTRCKDFDLIREDWPWLVPKQEAWVKCPLVGGYSFRALDMARRNTKLCEEEWRPSRMESECILGEGITLSFPKPACSPLKGGRQTITLQCWGNWTDRDHTYILAAEVGRSPRFALRFPAYIPSYPLIEFHAFLYFSPILPNSKDGWPAASDTVSHYELVMKQDEAGICYDESDQCAKFNKQRKCTNSALFEFANFCKRSCGLCDLAPSTRAECRFPDEMGQDWVLFEDGRRENVSINEGIIRFSVLGNFICKAPHWDKNKYKLLSHYHNGCRPRYSCMQFKMDMDGILLFQLSQSYLEDDGFDMCVFQDDPAPLGDSIRSQNYKTLLPRANVKEGTCGINGVVTVHRAGGRGRSCRGSVSDWNAARCGLEARVSLQLSGKGCVDLGSDGRRNFKAEYICEAYLNIEEGYSLLITRNEHGLEKYQCWVVETYAERMNSRPWKAVYLLPTAQCGRERDLDPHFLKKAAIALVAESDQVGRPCEQQSYEKELPLYNVDTEGNGRRDRVRLTKPERETGHLYKGESYTSGQSRTCSQVTSAAITAHALLCILHHVLLWGS